MTRLAGEFRVDLPLPEVSAACARAIQGLGWQIEAVEPNRIVSRPDAKVTQQPPKIEVVLRASGETTAVRISGSDTDVDPLEEDDLIADLNRVHHAIQDSVQAAIDDSAHRPPPGWYQNPSGPGSRWWDGTRWTDQVHEPQAIQQPAVPRPAPRSEARGSQTRIGMWLLIGLGAVAIAGALAAGAWFLFLRDTGPSERELAAQERAREQAQAKAKAQAAADECEQQLGGLLAALTDLQGRLQGVGVNYEEYGRRVGDVSSAYNQTPIGQLGSQCTFTVGIFAEKATNSYIEAGNVWNDCFSDINCDVDSIDPELQDNWSAASASIRAAKQGLSELRTP